MFACQHCLLIVLIIVKSTDCDRRVLITTDELENHISPEDLREFLKIANEKNTTTSSPVQIGYADIEDVTSQPVPEIVDCFGLGSITRLLFNMRPDSSSAINTHFYFSSRKRPDRVQVFPGDQFGLEWVDFDPWRKTVMIVHGFMSHSNASWVHDMTRAFLDWDSQSLKPNVSIGMVFQSNLGDDDNTRADVNVIAVDWSGGGNTWKYWRAVANTRQVGSDVTGFLRQLIAKTGARTKDFHFVGHSLGAHISSYVSYHLGRVARITGLDPAQPCFRTSNRTEKLDNTDADFVDVIHTNGRLLTKIGFGLPDPIGHADFYPNGGMKQPGCFNKTNSIWSRLLPISPSKLQKAIDMLSRTHIPAVHGNSDQQLHIYGLFSEVTILKQVVDNTTKQAICSHGRAYLLFTESLINNNCTFMARRWNLTYEGVNASLVASCDRTSCAEMGIAAVGGRGRPRARGPYFVLTTEKEPYCPTESERRHPLPELLRDLRNGLRLDKFTTTPRVVTDPYADPDLVQDVTVTENTIETTSTTAKSFWRWIG